MSLSSPAHTLHLTVQKWRHIFDTVEVVVGMVSFLAFLFKLELIGPGLFPEYGFPFSVCRLAEYCVTFPL
jgi:hypothetical protein